MTILQSSLLFFTDALTFIFLLISRGLRGFFIFLFRTNHTDCANSLSSYFLHALHRLLESLIASCNITFFTPTERGAEKARKNSKKNGIIYNRWKKF